MDGRRRRTVRGIAGVVLLLCAALLVESALAAPVVDPSVTAPSPDSDEAGPPLASPTPADERPSNRTGVELSPRPDPRGLTVVTTQSFYTGGRPGARNVAELVAFDHEGTVVYHEASHDAYFDVDPVPETTHTVEYVAADRLGDADCGGGECSLNVVERVNLSTGAVTRIYEAITPEYDTGRWHDVDRINGTHLLVADIVYDRVFVVDVSAEAITWQWNVSEHFPPGSGGGTGDWAHVNDVERLADGRLMVSVRNMDSVVFLHPANGVVGYWTLGADDAHDILYEQHNPDYIPRERGGPAVLVADSENNRVVEYHRVGREWRRAWSWRDGRLQWPRDADRLANGHTLIADSHGNRVIEVDTGGSVAWQVDIGRPYEVERLGSGGESASGYAAGSLEADATARSSAPGAPPAIDQQPVRRPGFFVALKQALPSKVVNGLLFVAPPWVGFTDLLVGAVALLDLLIWGGFEWRWSGRSATVALGRLGR